MISGICSARLEDSSIVCKVMWFLSVVAVVMMATANAAAQLPGQEDEQQRFLEVRRWQVELRAKRAELERNRELFEQGLISQAKLEESVVGLERAQLSYQAAVLELVQQPPRISVQRAVKFEGEDGRKLVRLTVANLTPVFDDEQFRLLNNFEGADPIPAELRTRVAKDVYVSLLGTDSGAEAGDGTIIALPYEVHIPKLDYGESKTMVFQLLQDTNSVNVSTTYRGQRHDRPVQLEQAQTDKVVTVTSTQVSQEVDLGGEAVYDLQLSRSTVDVGTYELRVFNLPPQINYRFQVPDSEARLSRLSFQAGVVEQELQLRLFLPDRATGALPLDESAEFFAAVLSDGQAADLPVDGEVTPAQLDQSRVGWARLFLIPRGVGKIEVVAPSLFGEVVPGESFQTKVNIRNEGTRALDNVTVRWEAPFGWRAQAQPEHLTTMASGEEASIEISIEPPSDTPAGDFEVRMITDSFTSSRALDTNEKTFRIRVSPRMSVIGVSLLAFAVVGLVGAIGLLWLRVNRR